jgi:Zn-dependent protease with chaperone function
MAEQRYSDAETLLQRALADDPQQVRIAQLLAQAIVLNQAIPGARAERTRPLVERFPADGVLACLHGLALAINNDARAAVREFDRARSLGTDPATVLPPDLVAAIEARGAMPWWERLAWVMAGFAGFYAVVMALMALTGLLMARWTRGRGALRLLGERPEELVRAGQVARTASESSLARLYGVALCLGLVFFYFAIPFIVVGVLGVTGLLLYGIFSLGRIPVQLVVIVVVVGLGMAWAVFKSLFSRLATGSFGLPKTPADCPRLHEMLAEVARRVDTESVREVFVAPGSAIGVHQEGRGPFGIFGVKRRVLTLGLSTMHYLTVAELQAILAHEYAHFSHRDTFYSRFIYQVELSIEQALGGMGQAGGQLNYVNPFFWFLYLYYKAYSMLAAGFSRSREFLADRMASTLYGSDVFASALTRVATDGALFEMTIYSNIERLLEQSQAFVNMYEAFRSFRDEQFTGEQREELYGKLLGQKALLFGSHPTFRERVEAVAELPRAEKPDARPARDLFEQPEAIEKELTEFLTGYIYHVRQAQAQAAAAAE